MHTKELMEANYMEALLRAALLLGEPGAATPVREIVISGFQMHNHVRRLFPRCRMLAQADAPGADYHILYPVRKPMPS